MTINKIKELYDTDDLNSILDKIQQLKKTISEYESFIFSSDIDEIHLRSLCCCINSMLSISLVTSSFLEVHQINERILEALEKEGIPVEITFTKENPEH